MNAQLKLHLLGCVLKQNIHKDVEKVGPLFEVTKNIEMGVADCG